MVNKLKNINVDAQFKLYQLCNRLNVISELTLLKLTKK